MCWYTKGSGINLQLSKSGDSTSRLIRFVSPRICTYLIADHKNSCSFWWKTPYFAVTESYKCHHTKNHSLLVPFKAFLIATRACRQKEDGVFWQETMFRNGIRLFSTGFVGRGGRRGCRIMGQDNGSGKPDPEFSVLTLKGLHSWFTRVPHALDQLSFFYRERSPFLVYTSRRFIWKHLIRKMFGLHPQVFLHPISISAEEAPPASTHGRPTTPRGSEDSIYILAHLRTSGSRGPWGPRPLPPRFFSKSCSF